MFRFFYNQLKNLIFFLQTVVIVIVVVDWLVSRGTKHTYAAAALESVSLHGNMVDPSYYNIVMKYVPKMVFNTKYRSTST